MEKSTADKCLQTFDIEHDHRMTTLRRMSSLPSSQGKHDVLTSFFWSNDAIRSRSVSHVVLHDTVDVPAPSAWLIADWETEISTRLELEPGDVEPLPLARARMRWPDYRHCLQAASDWTGTLGIPDLLASCDVALMACRGAKYHHDGGEYGGFAFFNLFLSEDKGLDLHFPGTGQRIPLVRGTVVIFDTGQAHALIRRGSKGFDTADFPPGLDYSQVFLTWELPIDDIEIAQALEIAFDVDKSTSPMPDEEQVWRNGGPASVCPGTGEWYPMAQPGA